MYNDVVTDVKHTNSTATNNFLIIDGFISHESPW